QRSDNPRADAPDGPLKLSGGVDLPARDSSPRQDDRRSYEPPGRANATPPLAIGGRRWVNANDAGFETREHPSCRSNHHQMIRGASPRTKQPLASGDWSTSSR